MPNNNFSLIDLYQQVWSLTPTLIVGREAMTAQDAVGIQANNALYNLTSHSHKPHFGPIATEPKDENDPSKQKNNGYSYNTPSMYPITDAKAPLSALGTPIMEQIVFKTKPPQSGGFGSSNATNAIAGANSTQNPLSKDYTYQLPGWPLFDITCSNVIEKTPNRGGLGSVKEYIYQDDYQITIRGFLINEVDDTYPNELLTQFKNFVNAKITFTVTSQVFNTLGINAIVVERWSLPSVEGFPNIQPFELNCVSDSGEDIIIQQTKDPTKQQVTK